MVLLALVLIFAVGEVMLRIRNPEQTFKATPGWSTCGAPANPYRLNLCGRGYMVTTPPPGTCKYFRCLPDFPEIRGYMARCVDGMYTMSGGLPGACDGHGGEAIAVYQG